MKNTKTKSENIKGEFTSNYTYFKGRAADFFRKMIVFKNKDQHDFTEKIFKSGAMGLNQAKKLFELMLTQPSDEGLLHIRSHFFPIFMRDDDFFKFINDSFIEIVKEYIHTHVKEENLYKLDVGLDDELFDSRGEFREINDLPISLWLELISNKVPAEDKEKAFKFLITYHYQKHNLMYKELNALEEANFILDHMESYIHYHTELKKYDEKSLSIKLDPNNIKINPEMLKEMKKERYENLKELNQRYANLFKDEKASREFRENLKEIVKFDRDQNKEGNILSLIQEGLLLVRQQKTSHIKE